MYPIFRVFSDSITFEKKRHAHSSHSIFRGWGARITILYTLLFISFFLLTVRLFHLTVVEGSENRDLSEENRVRTINVHAPRGTIFDRRGKAVTKNIPAFRMTGPCEENKACNITVTPESNWVTQSNLRESVFAEKDFIREYEYPYETAHVLGFLGEMTADEISNPLYKYQEYVVGDWIGRSGLEKTFEKQLRGIDGKELIEINAAHTKLRTLGKIDAIPGRDVTVALDIDLQRVAFNALGEYAGAVVVSKPKTGEILALVSTPSYNANAFHTGMSDKEYQLLLTSSDQPLFNRAVSGVYPPGSTFKIISSIAGLESGSVTPQTIIDDTGILRVGEFSFANWYFTQYGGTEGSVDMIKAIARSNDIYFYKLGEATGIDTIAKWGDAFGIGHKTGLELTNEAEGLMPNQEYKRTVYHDQWYLGDSYHIAIGQGDLQTTPLQVNRFTNVIASGGVLCNFTLIKADGKDKSGNCKDLGIKKNHIDVITEGMRRACYKGDDVAYQGTGFPFFDFTVRKETIDGMGGRVEMKKVPVACKTGTAEFGDQEHTHAWFTAFAPLPADSAFVATSAKEAALVKEGVPSNVGMITGEPEIVVTVLVEKGGEGSQVAAPIAKKIMEEWFRR